MRTSWVSTKHCYLKNADGDIDPDAECLDCGCPYQHLRMCPTVFEQVVHYPEVKRVSGTNKENETLAAHTEQIRETVRRMRDEDEKGAAAPAPTQQ